MGRHKREPTRAIGWRIPSRLYHPGNEIKNRIKENFITLITKKTLPRAEIDWMNEVLK